MRQLHLLLLLSLLLCTSCGERNTPDDVAPPSRSIILTTDSDEWQIALIRENVNAYTGDLSVPKPMHLPTHAEANVLKKYVWGSGGKTRYMTNDGYTFGMPSASVTAAGSSRTYSVLGLYRRKLYYDIEF